MKREQLQELGLEKETIDKVMALHGQTIQAEKQSHESAVNTLKEELAVVTAEVSKLNASIEPIDQIQAELNDYKTKYEEANSILETERKTNKLKEALTGAGGTDLEYLMYKLGDVGADEIEAKVTELKEQLPGHFKAQEEVKPEAPEGYEVLSNKLDKGTPAKTYTHEELSNLSVEEINNNWEVISQSLIQ